MLTSLSLAVSALALLGAVQTDPPDNADREAEIAAQMALLFETELATLAEMDCDDADVACLDAELVERYRVDQWAREEVMTGTFCGRYGDERIMDCLGMAMGSTAFQVDLPNAARLKHIVARHGWPQPPAFSEEAHNAAWYLAQHAMVMGEDGSANWDVAFAESVLPRVREAVEAGQLTPWHYAAMFDRIARASGEPQRFATQIMCSGGSADFGALEDPDRVTEFRAEIGMGAFDRAAYDAYCAESTMPGEA